MIETSLENVTFLRPRINGVEFSEGRFYASSNKTEGKFVIYRKDDKMRLYGLLWSDDSVQRKSISGDWYDFDMKKIDYPEIIPWIHRVRCQYPFHSREFNKTFDVDEELLGGGYLTYNPWNLVWRTFHDRDFQRAPINIINKCLEIESRVIKVEVVDEINERVFRYESSRH